MSQTYLAAMRRKDTQANPLFTFLGAQLADIEDGEALIAMAVGPHLAQGAGLVAGGILATLADEAMAHAVMTLLLPGQSIVTAEMNIRFLRATRSDAGGLLTAKAHVVKMGSHISVAECEIFHTKGRLLATAGATFSVRQEKS